MAVERSYLYRIVLVILSFVFINTVVVIISGGYRISLGFLTLSAHDARKSLLLLLVLAFMARTFFAEKRSRVSEQAPAEIPRTTAGLSAVKVSAILLLILLVVLGIYHEALNAVFISDDFEFLSLFRRSRTLTFDVLFGFLKGIGLIRPLSVASLWLDYSLWSLDPLGYHLTSILLHAATSFLVFLLLYALGRRYVLSAFCALIFAVYPVHHEAVAWISGRTDLLCGFFFLLALLFYVVSRKRDSWRSAAALLSLVSFLLALGAKEMAMTLPLVIILVDGLMPHDGRRFRLRKARFYVPYVFMSAIYIAVRILYLGNLGGYVEEQRTFFRIEPGFLYDLRSLVIRPFAALAVPLNRAAFANSEPFAAALLLLIAALTMLLLFKKGKNSPLIGWGASLTVFAVLPAFRILFISQDMQGSRHLYLAAVGASIIIAGTVESLLRMHRRLISVGAAVGSIVVLGLFAGISYVQTTPWILAAGLSKKIVNDGARCLSPIAPGNTVYVADLPDNIQGAYVFRNGFPSAMHLAGIPDGVRIAEIRKIPPAEIARREKNLVLQWDGTAFRLSEWSFDRLVAAAKKR